jgi:hypothetical protein
MDLVPETFIDAVGEISFKHGMIRIDLVSMSGTEPRVTQRLITSLQAFSQMLQAQNGMFEQLEKAGVIRPTAPQPGPHPDPPPQAGEGEGKEGGGVAAAVRRLVRMEPVPRPVAVAAPPSEPAPEPANLGPPRSPNFSDEQ